MTVFRIAGAIAVVEWPPSPVWAALLVVAAIVVLEVRAERRRRRRRDPIAMPPRERRQGPVRPKPGMTVPVSAIALGLAVAGAVYAVIVLAWWLWP